MSASEPRAPSVAVVGAGVAGLVAARALRDAGHRVRVFEKARGPGGRCSTRREGDLAFDHGAQEVTAEDPRFARLLEGWAAAGVVRPWLARFAVLDAGMVRPLAPARTRWVGVPRMSAITRHLAGGLDLVLDTRVAEVAARPGGGWRLRDERGIGLGDHDAVLVTAPPEQAVALLAGAPALAARAAAVRSSPCWAVLVAFPAAVELGFDAAFVEGSPLAWAARGASRPDRGDDAVWVLHASAAWSEAHLEASAHDVADDLLAAFGVACGVVLPRPARLKAHLWRLAQADAPLRVGALVDEGTRLAAAGAWCQGGRVEGAALSALAAAGALAGLLR